MNIAILGHPFAGKQTLADALAPLLSLQMVSWASVDNLIKQAVSPQASHARVLAESGAQVPESLFGELLAEATAGRESILVGRPRTSEELAAFRRASERGLAVIHLDASPSLVDARREAAGLGPCEADHPGALRRLSLALQPILLQAGNEGRLLTLDASLTSAELVERARIFIEQQN